MKVFGHKFFLFILLFVVLIFSCESQDKEDLKLAQKDRASGILIPISALPGKDIGNFGKVAKEFLLQLKASGQKLWQVLPIGSTILYDSPFYSPSAFAISSGMEPNGSPRKSMSNPAIITRIPRSERM